VRAGGRAEAPGGAGAMTLRARVDRSLCMSSGRCVGDAPAQFRFDADELAEAIPGAPALEEDVALRIARNCPAGAISLFREDGAEVPLR